MNIKDILKRNSPVFFIGIITLVVFLIIIATSQLKNPVEPTLIQTREDELVAQHTNIKGPKQAPILVTAFYDFSHISSYNFHYTIKKLLETYPNYVSVAIRHFPNTQNKDSFNAAKAAQAAGNQGRFWEFLDLLFENQGKFQEGDFVRYADILNLDLRQFRIDLNDPGIEAQVIEDVEYGKGLGVVEAPTFFLNGNQIAASNPDVLKKQVEDTLRNYGIDIEGVINEAEIREQEIVEQTYNNIYNIVDQRFGIKEISFVDGNFDPRNTSATAGQLVKFTNNSENSIVLTQIMDKYEALDQDVTLQPGESFEFRLELRRYGLWTYRNVGNPTRASIMVGKLPEDLMQLLPEED